MLSVRASQLSLGLSRSVRKKSAAHRRWLTVPGVNVCVTADQHEILTALDNRYLFDTNLEQGCNSEIRIERSGDILRIYGPAGPFIADCAIDTKTFFAAGDSTTHVFAGSYAGWHRLGPQGIFFAMLDCEFARQIFAASTASALLHTAWLRSPQGRHVLLSGPSGAGKTTLCAVAVSAGWDLLADDMVALMPDGALQAFPRRSWPVSGHQAVLPISQSSPLPASAPCSFVNLAAHGERVSLASLDAVASLSALAASAVLSRNSAGPAFMNRLAASSVWSFGSILNDPEQSFAILVRRIF